MIRGIKPDINSFIASIITFSHKDPAINLYKSVFRQVMNFLLYLLFFGGCSFWYSNKGFLGQGKKPKLWVSSHFHITDDGYF